MVPRETMDKLDLIKFVDNPCGNVDFLVKHLFSANLRVFHVELNTYV